MAEILREYVDRLDELLILEDLRRYQANIISKQNLYNFFKVKINFFKDIFFKIIYNLRFFFDP